MYKFIYTDLRQAVTQNLVGIKTSPIQSLIKKLTHTAVRIKP